MTRAEKRRALREQKKSQVRYNMSLEEINNLAQNKVREEVKQIKDDAMDNAINTAMTLLFVLPMRVLMQHYWQKTYKKRLPEFCEYLLSDYTKWQNGELDMDEMKKELWEIGGLAFQENEVKEDER